jgi:hypothetical protein
VLDLEFISEGFEDEVSSEFLPLILLQIEVSNSLDIIAGTSSGASPPEDNGESIFDFTFGSRGGDFSEETAGGLSHLISPSKQ